MEPDGRNSAALANLLDKLTDSDPHRVVEMGRDVQSLTSHDGWLAVAQLLAELRKRSMDDLLRGKPLEQAEYAQRLGFLNGVNTALDAVATVLDSAAKARQYLDNSARQAQGVA